MNSIITQPTQLAQFTRSTQTNQPNQDTICNYVCQKEYHTLKKCETKDDNCLKQTTEWLMCINKCRNDINSQNSACIRVYPSSLF